MYDWSWLWLHNVNGRDNPTWVLECAINTVWNVHILHYVIPRSTYVLTSQNEVMPLIACNILLFRDASIYIPIKQQYTSITNSLWVTAVVLCNIVIVSLQMDPFLIQFCNFIIQLLWSGRERDESPATVSSSPNRLQLDLTREQALVYFPSQLRRSFKDSSHSDPSSVETVALSSLLSGFKNYVKKRDALVHENKLLAGKAKLVQSLTVRNAHLEEEIWKCRKVS